MPSKTIETRAHTTKDGRLNLSVDVEVPDADVTVVVTVTPVPAGSGVDANGWPEKFFDRIAGSMPELRRGSQGEFEERLPLFNRTVDDFKSIENAPAFLTFV